MPDGIYTKAEVVAKIRATQPKSAGFSDDQIIERLIKKAPDFAQKITDYSTQPTKPAAKTELPMFQQQYEATMKVGQAKPVTTEVDDFTAIQKKKEKARVLSEPITISAYAPGATEQYQKNVAEAQKLDAESSKDLEKFNKTFNSSPLYTGLVADSEKNLENFRAKDVEGFDYVDQQRLREYVRTKVPQAANTGFETFLMNKLSGNLSYKMDEPKIMKKATEIAKQKKISLPDNWMNIDKEYSKKAKDVSDNVSKQFDAVSAQAEAETMQLNNAYKTTAEGITNKYKNPEFQKNFASEAELMQAYKQESSASFDEYTKQFSNSKRKYNQLSQKLQSDYEKALNALNVSGEKDAKKVADLLKESVLSLNDDKNATKFSMVGFVPTSGLPSAVTRFTSSFGRGLTGWLNSMGSYIDMNSDSQVATSFRDFTANLAKKFENPNIKIDKAKDLLDINKVTAFTGDQLARMAPGLVTASVVSGATGGVGIPAAIPILAGGTVGWLDQVMQATGDNYNTLIEQGLDPEEAKKRANRTYAGYLAAYPLTVFGMGGILGKYGAGSFIKRYGAGVAAEMATEVPEEIIQNEQDEAIAQNRKMDFGKMADLNNVYKTTLSVLPTIGLVGAPGAIRESSAAGEGFVPEWVSRVANAPVQSLSRNILMNGLYANAAAIESMRHNGMITEEGSIQMQNKMAEIKADMDAAKTAGLNKKQQSTYAGLMANVRTMEESAAEIANQDMDATAKEEAVNKANKRLENSKQAAADFLKTKNGNYAEVYDKDGDRYIVSYDELNEMLEDKSFTQDVRRGDARVQLFYDKKAGDLLGDVSKKLLSLNKDYSSGIREYSKSEQNTNALRARLGIPTQPTSSTTIDGLIGQKGTFTLSRFPARVTTEGTLAVQNGKLVIEEDGGAITELGNASEFTGVAPSFIGMEFTPPKYTGPKMTQAEAKLPSLLAMYAGKIDPKTLVSILGDMISDIKKPQLTKLVNAFDNAYQRKQQQKAINESLPKPQKLINVEPTEVGLDVDGIDVANTIAMVGDRNANTLTAKMLRIFSKPFISNSIDLDELHESSEEFRARVEEVRGQKQGQYNQEFSNPENVPAVMVDGKIIDGMGRLAQLYVNGQKTATVFENTKIEQDATQASEREIEEGAEPSSISEYQGTEETGTQAATVQTSPSNRPVSSKGKIRIKTTPAFGKFTRENIDKLFNITGLSKMQRKVINDARKVFDAIDKLVSKAKMPLSIHVHSQSSFERAVIEAGGTSAEAISRGFYMASDGSIHLNMDNIASDTMLHEGFHPILDYLQANNPAVINRFFKQLESIPEAAKIIKQAKDLYKGTETQQKEAITDFVAGVADGRIVLNPSNFQKIKAFILDLLSKIGLGEGSTLMDVNTELDLIKLAEFVTEKFTGGEAITKAELGVFSSKQPSKEKPIATSGQLQFSKTIYNTSNIVKSPALDSDEYRNAVESGRISAVNPYESLKDKFFAITFPDDFFTGEIKYNNKTIAFGNGGVFFAAKHGQKGDLWAAAGQNSANNFVIQANESLRKNNGEGIVVLSKGDDIKQSTSLEANIAFINTVIKYAESVNELPSVIKGIKAAYSVGKAKSADSIIESFNEFLKAGRGESGQRMVDAKKAFDIMLSALIKEAGPVMTSMLKDMGFDGDTYFNKTKLKNGEYVATTQGLKAMFVSLLQEDFLKGVNNGAVYAALKFNSPLKYEQDLYHPSYPFVIKTVDGSPIKLEVFTKTFNSYGKEGVAIYGQERNKENAFGVATTTKADFKLDPNFEDNPSQKNLSEKLDSYKAFNEPQFQKATPTKSSYETVDKSALGRMLGDSERAKAIKRNLAKGIPIWQQWFTTFKKFGESITESNDYKVGYINKEIRKANKYVDQTISALKKSAKEGTPVSDKDVTAFMEGDQTALNNYPPYVAIAVTNMRMHIDALTDTLITFGAITDPAEIALFRANKGKYFGRYYDLFINGKNDISLENIKDRLKNVDQSVIDAAKNVIRTELRKSVERQNVGKTQDEIDAILERRVTDQIEKILTGRENKYVKTPTQGSVNMRVLTERMDIKPEIRALMGEVANPLVRYYATIKKMSDLAAGVRYLNEFRTEGLGKFLFEQNDPNRPDGANFEISTDNNPNLQPLGGLWTYKEFYDELTKNLEPESLNRFDQIAGKAFAASKYLKTVANPGTHAKNVISNVFIMINNGYMGVDLFNAIATLSTDAKFREQLLDTLTESNVLSNNIGLQEINSFIKQNDDLDKIIADKFSDKSNKVKYSYEKVKGWLSGAYQFEDEIFKMLAFMVEAERYSNDIYGVTYKNLASSKKAEVDKLMSKRIKNVMPTFSRVPAFVKATNKYLYLGAFMAYTAESVRIEKNNFMIAIKELSDPRTRVTGGKRLAGMATLNYMFWSKTAGAGAAVGALATGAFTYGYSALQALMDDEDEQAKEQMSQREKDIRLWVREFSQSSDLASIKITDKGISYVDIGAYHPFGYRHKIMNRFDQLTRDNEEGVIMDAARSLGAGLDPWIQPDFTVKSFLDALNNTDKYNKEISNSNDPSWKKTIDQSSYFIKESFSPGMVNNMIRAYRADQKGDPEKVKKSFQDILVREDEIEFTKSFYYKFKNEWDTKFNQANKYYNDAVSAGESPEDIQEAFNKSVDTKKRIIDDVVKYYQSAIRMGASAEEMAAIVEKMAPTNKIANMIKGDFKYTDYSDYVQPRD